jgi:hypothetical protein
MIEMTLRLARLRQLAKTTTTPDGALAGSRLEVKNIDAEGSSI